MNSENPSKGTEFSGAHDDHDQWENIRGGVCEIEEVVSSEVSDDNNDSNMSGYKLPSTHHLQSIKELDSSNSVRSYGDEDSIYVVISSKEETASMDALLWAIDHEVGVRDSSVIFLIHVFPETNKFIPTPLGKLPTSQANPEQKETFMAKERGKRREYLHKFINVCDTSQVKVDTILIESDMEAKAIGDLIPILGIKKLILGTTKPAYVRTKLRNKRGNGMIDQIVQNAPEFCQVKIIYQGKEMSSELMMNIIVDSPLPSPMHTNNNHRSPQKDKENANDEDDHLPACSCFKI